MAFTNPNVIDAEVPDFENLGLNGGGGVASCKLAPRGLYCLATRWPDGGTYQVVRFWKDPKASPRESSDLLRCDLLIRPPMLWTVRQPDGRPVRGHLGLGDEWHRLQPVQGCSPKEFDPMR